MDDTMKDNPNVIKGGFTMKQQNTKQHLRLLGLVLGVVGTLYLAGCGNTTASGTDDAAAEDDTVAANASAQALTDGATNALSALSGGSGLALRAQEEAGGSETQERSMSAPDDCSYDSEAKTVTCACPKGGSMTHTFAEGVTIQSNIIEFNHTVTTTFNDCAVESCGADAVMNGQFSGEITGTHDIENPENQTTVAHFATAEACSGISINDLSMGLDLTVRWSNGQETVSGKICTSATGEIEFDSFEDLMEVMDPVGSCQAS